MFTPERLAHIAKSDAEIDAGDFSQVSRWKRILKKCILSGYDKTSSSGYLFGDR